MVHGHPRPRGRSADVFLRWAQRQTERHELVNGVIVTMMAGGTQSHNVVKNNVEVVISPLAKKGGCRTTSSDTAVRTGPRGVRLPDIVVDCGKADPTAIEATEPRMVVEVASASMSELDATDKLEEYQAHPDIRLIMLVEPNTVQVKLYRRDLSRHWSVERYDGLDQVIDLREIEATLPVSGIYDTLSPTLRPKLKVVETEIAPESEASALT